MSDIIKQDNHIDNNIIHENDESELIQKIFALY